MKPEEKVRQEQHGIQTVSATTETVREQDKFMLVLAYLAPLSLIPLLTVKDSEFVKWHAKNGLVLGIGAAVVMMVLQIIPVIGQLAGCVLWLGAVVADIMAMVKSLRGERWRIPVVSDLADKF